MSTDELAVGDIITYGWSDISKYDETFNLTYNSEQIQWIVLDKDVNKGVLLLSKNILMREPYDDNNIYDVIFDYNINWSNSSLFGKLNIGQTSFFTHSFTNAEKKRIPFTQWDENDNSRVSILSYNEYLKYKQIPGVVITGAGYSDYEAWWLRTAFDNLRIYYIMGDDVGHAYLNIPHGVRPVIYFI